jgi:N-acyl-D-aspartate/D-glutamate deacylase
LLIRGGDVVDGSGAPRWTADVRCRAGRIVEVGPGLRSEGEDEIDAGGAVVAPGFMDTHAHTDPQVFWNPSLDPEPLHGVTTMLVGNCGLTLYPASPANRAEICDLFAYLEDVPRHLFDDCLPWTWTDFAGYRAAVDRVGTGANIAALVGHSPLRIAVMGDDAWSRVATADERTEMAALLDQAMAAGAWGLSVSFYDVDKAGRPIPSRWADGEEFDALIDVIARYDRGLVELLPGLIHPDPEKSFEDLARRCGHRDVSLTWTGFVHADRDPAVTDGWLDFTRRLAADGIRVHPQLSPRTVDFRVNWSSSMMFMSMTQGWHRLIGEPAEAKPALLRDPEWRRVAREEWDRVDSFMFPHRHPEMVRIVEVHNADDERWLACSLADLVAERGGHPSDVLADFVLANDCRPGVVAVGIANADVEGVARVMADPSVIISSSDAGAHVQMMCASGDSTLLLTRHVRERGDFSLEWAVHQLAGRQAEVFGFDGRGIVAPGNVADLTVFALDELHYDADGFVDDLPGGGSRLRRPEGGYRATIVAGVPVQLAGEITGALPGRVLGANDASTRRSQIG